MHERKAKDYGTGEDPYANMRESNTMGIPPHVGVTIRMNDKMVRIKSIIKKGYAANESLRDSYLDLVNYAAFAVMFLDESTKGLPDKPVTIADDSPAAFGHIFIGLVDKCSICGITGQDWEERQQCGQFISCEAQQKLYPNPATHNWVWTATGHRCSKCDMQAYLYQTPDSQCYKLACDIYARSRQTK